MIPNDTFGLKVYVKLYVTGMVKRNLSEAILKNIPKTCDLIEN